MYETEPSVRGALRKGGRRPYLGLRFASIR